MLTALARPVDGTPVVRTKQQREIPVPAALSAVLSGGLRRGSTISVSGSMSLLLALLGAASAEGAWCALVGFPPVSAEAAVEYGVDPSRLVLVRESGPDWVTAVGPLLDAFDVVAVRPSARVVGEDVRRVAARVRMREVVLVPFAVDWPGADVQLHAQGGEWCGLADGFGRLRARQVEVTTEGRGRAARARSATLWLPAHGGGIASCERHASLVASA